jgi:hypothetical protein
LTLESKTKTKIFHCTTSSTTYWQSRQLFTRLSLAQLLAFEFTCLLRESLSQNAHRLIRTKHCFNALLNEDTKTWLEPTAGQRDAKLLGLKNDSARALWRCQQSTWIPRAAHDQAAYLVELINRHLLQGHQRWFRPTSHIIRRREDQLQYQDASSSYGLGGHIPALQIYWTLAWNRLWHRRQKLDQHDLEPRKRRRRPHQLARIPRPSFRPLPCRHLGKTKSHPLARPPLSNRRQHHGQQTCRQWHSQNHQQGRSPHLPHVMHPTTKNLHRNPHRTHLNRQQQICQQPQP